MTLKAPVKDKKPKIPTCSKCSAKPVHSILVRHGHLPNSLDPEAGKKDKSRLHVYGFCAKHWAEVKTYLPGLG